MKKLPSVLVAYFGILRSLNLTSPSLKKNIITPLSKCSNVISCAHLYNIAKICNPRSGEYLDVDFNPSLLNPTVLEVDIPDRFLNLLDYDLICSYGDTWNDGYKSIRNLLNQLYSLLRIKSVILEMKPDYVFFCRPDLYYHFSILNDFHSILEMSTNSAIIPFWQRFGGLNDRFAFCDYKASLTYASRFNYIYDFLSEIKAPLNGERLLHYAFLRDNVQFKASKLTASRCRANGFIKFESFSSYRNIGARLYLRDEYFYIKKRIFDLIFTK